MPMLCERLFDRFAAFNARWLSRLDEHGREHLHHFLTALLTASVVHLLHDFHLPLELPTNSLALSFAEQFQPPASRDPLNEVAIVHLDVSRYRSGAYQGTSPLNRCTLADDLKRLLANKRIETVAVDFFMAPTYRVGDEEKACQAQLDDVLDRHPGRIVAIRRRAQDEQAQKWLDRRSGVEFGHSELADEFGMVRRHGVTPGQLPAFADLVAARICRSTIPEDVRRKRCDRLFRQSDHGSAEQEEKTHFHPIVFGNLKRFHSEGKALPLTHSCFDQEAQACSGIRHVFFGSSFSEDDEFLTPIGVRAGVDVHAAIASEARNHESHLEGFMIDIVVGFFLGWLIHWCWEGYFNSRMGVDEDLNPHHAYLWLVWMMSLIGVALAALVVASNWIFVSWAIWISPVPMAIGAVIDSLIVGSTSVAGDLLSGSGHSAHGHGGGQGGGHGNSWPRAKCRLHAYPAFLKNLIDRPCPGKVVAWMPRLAFIATIFWVAWILIQQELS